MPRAGLTRRHRLGHPRHRGTVSLLSTSSLGASSGTTLAGQSLSSRTGQLTGRTLPRS